jgi:dienelactone hydrolase
MFPLRYILEFKAKMEAQGCRCECKVYTNAEHGFFYDLTRRQQKEAFADILRFIDSLK